MSLNLKNPLVEYNEDGSRLGYPVPSSPKDPTISLFKILIDHRSRETGELYENPIYIMMMELENQKYKVESRNSRYTNLSHKRLIAQLFREMADTIEFYPNEVLDKQ